MAGFENRRDEAGIPKVLRGREAKLAGKQREKTVKSLEKLAGKIQIAHTKAYVVTDDKIIISVHKQPRELSREWVRQYGIFFEEELYRAAKMANEVWIRSNTAERVAEIIDRTIAPVHAKSAQKFPDDIGVLSGIMDDIKAKVLNMELKKED